MSFINYKPEILIAGEWLSSCEVYSTKEESDYAAFRMLESWSEAEDYRSLETIEPVTAYVHINLPPNKL